MGGGFARFHCLSDMLLEVAMKFLFDASPLVIVVCPPRSLLDVSVGSRFSQRQMPRPKRQKTKVSRYLIGTDRWWREQPRLREVTHVASHDKCIAVRHAASVEQSHVRPDSVQFRSYTIRRHIEIVAGMNIGEQTTRNVFQACLNKAEKCLCAQMIRNTPPGIRIQDDCIVAMPAGAQKIPPIGDMTIDVAGKSEILPGDLKCPWIDVDDGNARTGSVQHGAKAAAAAPDHQDVGRLRLCKKTKDRMYIGHNADAFWIAFALIAAALTVNKRSRFLRTKDFNIAKIAMIFCNSNHDLVAVARF